MTDTTKYKLNHSMIRISDVEETKKWFELLGMSLVNKFEFPDNRFDLLFFAYDGPDSPSHGNHWTDREGIIEVTYNYPEEGKPPFKPNNGNGDEGKGFGHYAITVDNIQAACKRISDAGYKFQKKLEDGKMHNIAFALDNSGYWCEIISRNPVDKTAEITTTDPKTYRLNHTMIRIKDAEKSLKFYQEVMGMTLIRTNENKDAGFTLYFLGYGTSLQDEKSSNGVNPAADREGLLELTWNHGTEKEEGPIYHNGNDEPQGFGHICVSVDDLDAACKRFEEKGVQWKKRLTDGRMKNVAFILDCDNYWIEIIQNEKYKPAPGKY